MHEMALAQSIVDIIETEATRQNFDRVSHITLEIGALSCVDARALEFGLDAVTKGTRAEGAKLEIITPPGTAYCFGCQANTTIARKGDACPECGSYQVMVTGGEDMKIVSLEVV